MANTWANTDNTNNSLPLDLTETLASFQNIMDFPVSERSEKLSTLTPLTNNIDKKIGDFLFMPKELVWLVHELKSFNVKHRKNKKLEKSKKEKTQKTNNISSINDTNIDISRSI